MIKVICKKLVKADKAASKYFVELICDEVDELPSSTEFDGWVIDMGSVAHVVNTGEIYMLNSEGEWVIQKKKSDEDVPFTQEDKAKLDSLTNPILLKGRVDTVEDLPEEAEIGWLYFVGEENSVNFAEYICTDEKQWEYIGDNSIDLSNYVKNTDYATTEKGGVVTLSSSLGIYINAGGKLRTNKPTDQKIIEGTDNYLPLVPSSISVFMSDYGITKTTIPDMKEQEALNKSSLGLQRKNLLKNVGTTQSKNGINFTVNEDGSVTADGTATEQATFYIARQTSDTFAGLKPGEYIYSGCSGGSSNTYMLRYFNDRDGETDSYKVDIYNEEKTITHTNSSTFNCAILVKAGTTLENQKFYPMLRCTEIADDTYEPYHPSLQEQIESFEARLAALESPQKAATLLQENPICAEDIHKDNFHERTDDMT